MSHKFDFAGTPWAMKIARDAAKFICHSQTAADEAFAHEPVNAMQLAIMGAIGQVQERLNEEYKDGLVTREFHPGGHVDGRFTLDPDYGLY